MMVFFLFIPFILFYLLRKTLFSKPKKSIENKHVVITGGSSGIGKSLAVLAAKQGADVTIIARNQQNLDKATEEVKQAAIRSDQKIQNISLDVSNYEAVEQKLSNVEETVGPIFMLVNCAGLAICGTIEDLSVDDIKKLVDVNYLGTVYPTKVVIPRMKQRKEGVVVITASQAALVGIFGLGAYAGTKFALRGFAEALDMEVQGHNMTVTVALPPDTDTPGFENENKSKPLETSLICKTGGLFQSNDIAEKILKDALEGSFFSSMGFESFITTTLCVGMSRFSTVGEVLVQALLLGPLRIISCFYLSSFHNIVKKCLKDKEKCK